MFANEPAKSPDSSLCGFMHQRPLLVSDLHRRGKLPLRSSAWYHKSRLTFSDTIAAVRQQLWTSSLFTWSLPSQDQTKTSHLLLQHLTEALCYAA